MAIKTKKELNKEIKELRANNDFWRGKTMYWMKQTNYWTNECFKELDTNNYMVFVSIITFFIGLLMGIL